MKKIYLVHEMDYIKDIIDSKYILPSSITKKKIKIHIKNFYHIFL